MKKKKEYEKPEIIETIKIEPAGGGCSIEPGNMSCETGGYVISSSI